MKQKFHFLVFVCVGFWSYTLAQPVVALQPGGNDSATTLFYKSISANSHLYNGTEYIMYDQHIQGDPYFLAQATNGNVYYDGTLYKDVQLLYELTTGNLVVRQHDNGVLICLVKQKVKYFNLFNHTFIHVEPDSGNTVITDGFYDQVYKGKTEVYIKRQKILYEDPSTYARSFIQNDKYFIYKNNIWHQVSSQGDILSLFKEHKKEIAKYLRQNKIKYKKDHERAMIKMAEYYDNLTH